MVNRWIKIMDFLLIYFLFVLQYFQDHHQLKEIVDYYHPITKEDIFTLPGKPSKKSNTEKARKTTKKKAVKKKA